LIREARLPNWRFMPFGQAVAEREALAQDLERQGDLAELPTLYFSQMWGYLIWGDQAEVTDEAHPFGRVFRAFGESLYFYEVAAYTKAAETLRSIVVQATTLNRTWLRRLAECWLVLAALRAGTLDDGCRAMPRPRWRELTRRPYAPTNRDGARAGRPLPSCGRGCCSGSIGLRRPWGR
jgi:hypothetical protein